MKSKEIASPRIENRKAFFDYHIEGKLECGIQLMGSEVKALRMGLAQLSEAFASIDGGQLILHNCHIEPYKQAAIVFNHTPRRPRKLLAHKREIKKILEETDRSGMTLIPTAMYFKDGRVKVEIAMARGKKEFDKRDSLRKKESDKELRRAMTKRQ